MTIDFILVNFLNNLHKFLNFFFSGLAFVKWISHTLLSDAYLKVQLTDQDIKFIKLYHSENLWMNTNLMCIGEKTSAILNEIKWKKIFLFNPGEEEFLLYKI